MPPFDVQGEGRTPPAPCGCGALRRASMGFCLLNRIAVAAAYAPRSTSPRARRTHPRWSSTKPWPRSGLATTAFSLTQSEACERSAPRPIGRMAESFAISDGRRDGTTCTAGGEGYAPAAPSSGELTAVGHHGDGSQQPERGRAFDRTVQCLVTAWRSPSNEVCVARRRRGIRTSRQPLLTYEGRAHYSSVANPLLDRLACCLLPSGRGHGPTGTLPSGETAKENRRVAR